MRTNILKFRLTTLRNHLNIHLQNIPHIRRSSNTTSLLKQPTVLSKSMGLPLWTSMVLDSSSNTTPDNRDLDDTSSPNRYPDDAPSLLLRLENRNSIPYVQSTRLPSPLQHANTMAMPTRTNQLETNVDTSHSKTTSRWTSLRMAVYFQLVIKTALLICVLLAPWSALANNSFQRRIQNEEKRHAIN